MKLYTGLDIHKKSIYGTMVDEKGKIIDQRNFDNDEESLPDFLFFRWFLKVLSSWVLAVFAEEKQHQQNSTSVARVRRQN